ncbi:uncharacterized protein LOC113384888 isoform X2 [Ctenocephalides felis]|uniref:uncharacterized protein LOC113384888 isoform X2 n=1 Tax=Ctenocephalides felis TaxID=7515 RepID=UPI000E6E25C9|nr:uncharacterized protein LOC113384888 isoform X2 [Ctenocephalides felis]
MKQILIILCWATLSIAQDLTLDNINELISPLDDDDDARRRKHHLLFGGLKGLSKFLSIKLKVLLALASIAIIVVVVIKGLGAFKLLGLGSCPEPVILTHETPTFYSEPHHHHEHHEHFSPESYSGPVYTEYPSEGGPYPAAVKRTQNFDMSGGRQMPIRVDIEDLAFRVLGVHSDVCRRRFVCEMDEKTNASSFLQFMFKMISKGMFDRYRDKNNKPKDYEDCRRLYSKCMGDNVFTYETGNSTTTYEHNVNKVDTEIENDIMQNQNTTTAK